LPPPLLRHRVSHPATLRRINADSGWPLQTPSFGPTLNCLAPGQAL
jgi:hypothetical protein